MFSRRIGDLDPENYFAKRIEMLNLEDFCGEQPEDSRASAMANTTKASTNLDESSANTFEVRQSLNEAFLLEPDSPPLEMSFAINLDLSAPTCGSLARLSFMP